MSKQLEFKDVYKWWPDNKVVTLEEMQMVIRAIKFLMENKPNDVYEYVCALDENIEAVRRELNNLVKDISKFIPDEIDKKEKFIQNSLGAQERAPS